MLFVILDGLGRFPSELRLLEDRVERARKELREKTRPIVGLKGASLGRN